MIDAGGKPLKPAAEILPDLLRECQARRGVVVETTHRQVGFDLRGPEVAGRLAPRLQVPPADLRGVVFGHRIAKGETRGLLVHCDDVRYSERIAPNLGPVRHRPLTVQRRTADEQQCRTDERGGAGLAAHREEGYTAFRLHGTPRH